MVCEVDVQVAPTIMADDEKTAEHSEGDRWDREEIHRSHRLAGSGSLGALRIQREIVRSETSRPCMGSSPWMRGALHVGFSVTIRKIKSRTTFESLLPLLAFGPERSSANKNGSLPDASEPPSRA